MKEAHIRTAISHEIEWINEMYHTIGFAPSNFETEFIMIAEMNGEKCGLGRLVDIDDNNVELGGIYVLKEYRGSGIAEKIVSHLLENTIQNKNIWCLPFEHLQNFYLKFDFLDQKGSDIEVPGAIKLKYKWCNQNYEDKVILLVKWQIMTTVKN